MAKIQQRFQLYKHTHTRTQHIQRYYTNGWACTTMFAIAILITIFQADQFSDEIIQKRAPRIISLPHDDDT